MTLSETTLKFAWFPVRGVDGKLIFWKKYFETRSVERTPHGCNDCFSTLTPCGGGEYDYIEQPVERRALEVPKNSKA